MIRMSGIRKTFRDGLRAMEVLSDFSLQVGPGEFVSIMGPSGSGKTTFLNIAGPLDDLDGDEPTGNLDSLMARQVMDLLREICEAGTTIVVVTHSQEIASRTQRKLHVLDGRVIDPWAERPSLTVERR